MTKRFIRLKELKADLNKVYTPSEEYLEINTKLQSNEVYNVITNSECNQISTWEHESKDKIYLLGDSSIESIYTRATMRPHSILEKLILESGYNHSVINQGVSGAQSLNILNLIINKLGNKQGSTVIVSLPSNDSSVLSLEGGYYNNHWRYSSIVPALNKNVPRTVIKDYDAYIRNIEMIISVCRILGLNLFLTSIIYTGENKKYEKLNKLIKSICKSRDTSFINLECFFKSRAHLFYDEVHLLPQGSKEYAEIVFSNIKNVLKTDSDIQMSIHNICDHKDLYEKIFWSEYFDSSNLDNVKVIIDADFCSDCERKQILMSVDYGREDVSTSLLKSSNDKIGYFKYITAPVGKRVELVIDLEIPFNCLEVRVGLRAWDSKNVRVHNAFVSSIRK
ncbi:SGNH/GDSL hydrolase family protein [Psychrobacter sp. FBL11]|uniref:SGNH/GDSL hydrolase family protein n=1 Tax=Psychrobacter saeujeotis TaxID=3143436 RepID=A0ABU9X9H3_9GAMM|nr:SGNH/GDSL hydrolase family protein [uncultured Psychrobacter sp.]